MVHRGSAARRGLGEVGDHGSVPSPNPPFLFAWLGILALLLLPAAGLAQTTDGGGLDIEVRDESGNLLQGVRVALGAPEMGAPLFERTTSSSGRIQLRFLPARGYTLDVERLGFVPVRVRDVQIVPDERQELVLTLRSGQPPITERDTFDYAELVPLRIPAGSEILRNRADLLVLEDRTARALPEFVGADAGPSLPLRFLGLELDGLPLASSHSPAMGPGRDRFYSVPLGFAERVRSWFPRHSTDRIRGSGSVVEMRTRAASGGTPMARIRLGTSVTSSDVSGEGTQVGPWIEALGSTRLQGDTLRATYGLEIGTVVEQMPTLLGPVSDSPATLAGVRAAVPGSELPANTVFGHRRSRIAGYSRIDWQMSETSWWTVAALASILPETDGIELPPVPEGVGSPTSGADILASSRFLSASDEGHAIQVDLSVQHSSRNTVTPETDDPDWLRAGLLAEGFTVAPMRDAAGEFGRTRFRVAPTGTWELDQLRLRGGMTLSFERWSDQRPDYAGSHQLVGSLGDVTSVPGLALRSEGSGRDLSVDHQRFSLFGEGRWTPARGLAVTLGTRLDWERFPFEDLSVDEAWLEAMGLVDQIPEGSTAQVSPSAELRWEPRSLAGWSLAIKGALHPGATEPGFIGTLFHSRDDAYSIRSFESDGLRADHRSRRLTLLGPEFRPPQTESISLRVDGSIHRAVRIGFEVFNHQTDFLPRRRDLNRIPGRGLVDQFSRSHRGEILTSGGLVIVRPGSDRRFPEFDRVWALESDGWSTTRGAGFGLTFEQDAVLVEAGYRWSESRDNAPFGPTGAPIPLDGSRGDDLTEADWVEGRSDRDRPHEFSVLASLTNPMPLFERVAVSYRGASGLPFTPGVRDALGRSWETGWTRLEPITLPAGAEGPASGDGWSCEALSGAGETRVRNSCRGAPVHILNARVTFGLPAESLQAIGITLEALNLLDRGEVLRDPALLVVDGSRSPSIDAASGTLDLPVNENASFGQPLMSMTDGRSFRISLEYRFQ